MGLGRGTRTWDSDVGLGRGTRGRGTRRRGTRGRGTRGRGTRLLVVADGFQRPWFGRKFLLAYLTVRTLGTE